MKQVLIKDGHAVVTEVPAPQVGEKNILVRVLHSTISVGTEMAGLRMSALPLYRRALKQPENVKKVMEMVRDQGLKRTANRVRGMLSAGTPAGYSAAGVVVGLGDEVTGFQLGDRVACAGAGIANHAEWIDVPVNLAVRIPEGLDTESASTVTLGAIAMQGVRRAQPTLGESILVVGLGILGQITVQLLKAHGCRVIGVDPDHKRVDLAVQNGLEYGINPGNEGYIDQVIRLTDGHGADATVITAASESHEIIHQAMQASRKKGRVVLVGDVGLNLNRSDFYEKELDFFISCSYGPGRYDPFYEEGGQDYPLPYVRWTENRNMEAYLQLLADGKVSLSGLPARSYPIEQASQAYAELGDVGEKPLLAILSYPQEATTQPRRKVTLRKLSDGQAQIRVAVVGAGSFAQGMHLPNLIKMRDKFSVQAIMSRTGANAFAVAKQYQAGYATTDYAELLNDPKVDLVMITTRHNLHAEMTLQALQAGKHVFVEKPLATTSEELESLQHFYATRSEVPLLMTGFNRRFSPPIVRLKEMLKNRSTPLIVNYRMNAGFIAPDHWIQGDEGAGRNIGEACHIYDLFNALTGAECIDVQAASINPSGKQWLRNDNFVATLRYADGSLCTLTYTAQGSKQSPKECMDVYADGKVYSLNDYKRLDVTGSKQKSWRSATIQKGQLQELEALADSLLKSEDWPISLEEQWRATRISLEVEKAIFSQ